MRYFLGLTTLGLILAIVLPQQLAQTIGILGAMFLITLICLNPKH